MSSLFDSLLNNELPETSGNDFPIKLGSYKTIVVNDYNKYGVDLNKSIAKIANEDKLNDNQIQRIVEEVNNTIYLEKYAALRKSTERDVAFDLALLPDIKKIMNGEEKVEEITKKASTEDSGDPLNFLNYSSHSFSSIKPEKTYKEEEDMLREKVAHEVKKNREEYDKELDKLGEELNYVCNALIQYDILDKSAQSVFDKICKHSGMKKDSQLVIKKALENRIKIRKQADELHDSYDLSVDYFDNVEDKFSLGDRSLLKKKAEEIKPIRIKDDRTVGALSDLIKSVQNIELSKNKLKTLGQIKKEIDKNLNI